MIKINKVHEYSPGGYTLLSKRTEIKVFGVLIYIKHLEMEYALNLTDEEIQELKEIDAEFLKRRKAKEINKTI